MEMLSFHDGNITNLINSRTLDVRSVCPLSLSPHVSHHWSSFHVQFIELAPFFFLLNYSFTLGISITIIVPLHVSSFRNWVMLKHTNKLYIFFNTNSCAINQIKIKAYNTFNVWSRQFIRTVPRHFAQKLSKLAFSLG